MPSRGALPSPCWLTSASLFLLFCSACGHDSVLPPGACEQGLLPGDLVITEIMANPAGADDGREWFELYNASETEFDLRGVALLLGQEDGTDNEFHRVLQSWTIPAGGYTVAGPVLNEDDVLAVVPYLDYGYDSDLGSMSNASGRLEVACGDRTIDATIYTEPGDGASRSFTGDRTPDATSNDDLSQWCDATTEFDMESRGTPGEPNDICIGTGGPLSCIDGGTVREARAPALGDVVITEMLANPEASEETDGEWVELYVGADIDLNGLALGTDPDELEESEPVASNDCIPVAAGTRLVFAREIDPMLNGGLPTVDQPLGFSLRNSDGQVVVSYAGAILDIISYESAPAGASLNLDPDHRDPQDNDDPRYLCPSTLPYGAGDLGSPGAANEECAIPPPPGQCLDGDAFREVVAPQPGDLVITELMPNPDAVGDSEGEWFELRANAAVDLNGLWLGTEEGEARSTVEVEDCLSVSAGDHVLLAREPDPNINGNLPAVDATFDFALSNSSASLWVGTEDSTLDLVMWSSSGTGAARSLDPAQSDPRANDDEGRWCDAVDEYGDGDLGTPGEPNPSCGGVSTGTCNDGGNERDLIRPMAGDLVITELMPNPDVVTDANGEWFEVLVTAEVDLNGLEFGDDPTNPDATLPPGGDCITVSAGQRVILARNADPTQNGGLPAVVGTFGFGLTNGGGTLFVGYGGEALDTITWSGSPTGASITLDPAAENPTDNDNAANFCTATEPYGAGDLGSPGTVGPACGGGMSDGMCLDAGVPRAVLVPTLGDLVITELMPNPDAVSDQNGEWFEVLATANVDLNGLEYGDDPTNPDATLPAGGDCITVSAGQRVIMARNADPTQNGGLPPVVGTFSFGLTNGGGTLFVGIGGAALDTITWSDSPTGASWSLDSGSENPALNDDEGNFCAATEPYGDGDLGTPAAVGPAC
ncbi:MAG: hypothetical protein AAGF11_23390 [Myxococcota bacterium]